MPMTQRCHAELVRHQGAVAKTKVGGATAPELCRRDHIMVVVRPGTLILKKMTLMTVMLTTGKHWNFVAGI